VKIDTKNPIELGDFVSEFTSVSSQYEKFMRENYPDLSSEAHMFVKQVKRGSIIFELLPFAPLVLPLAGVVTPIEHINAVNEFIKHYGSRLKAYLNKNGKPGEATKSDLRDFMGAVAAIANDPKGTATIEAVAYEDGKRKVRAAIRFSTPQATRAAQSIERQQRKLEKSASADHQRVLMVFKQSNVKDSPVGKRTGEWVQIEKISDKELPLIYASDLAERRIKHEIREAEDNVYKKGFIVDVNVETKGGRPVGYRVTNSHQVIDLPDGN
jgi:hypothetical protein